MLPVPVLVITGAVGAGKTTTAYEVSLRLREGGVSHVVIDDEFGLFFPRLPDDPTGERVRNEALAAIWSTYAAAGVERVVIARALEDNTAIAAVREAIPGAEIAVFVLDASLAALDERIDQKGVSSAREWCRTRAREFLALWANEPLLDAETVHTDGRSPIEVAAEIVRRSGWM